MSDTLQGRRVPWPDGLLLPSEYALGPDGNWYAMTPNGHLANLGLHRITEHADGTITASPSILVSIPSEQWTETRDEPKYPVHGEEAWHGYLERGVWRHC